MLEALVRVGHMPLILTVEAAVILIFKALQLPQVHRLPETHTQML
jgi:hypothetical protein